MDKNQAFCQRCFETSDGVPMRIFGLKNCDTCRKALKNLKNSGRVVEFVDIHETPLSSEQIERYSSAFGDRLVNTRSTTWRGLDAATRSQPVDVLLALHPTVMKRPVIEAEDLHLGWGKDVQDALL